MHLDFERLLVCTYITVQWIFFARIKFLPISAVVSVSKNFNLQTHVLMTIVDAATFAVLVEIKFCELNIHTIHEC